MVTTLPSDPNEASLIGINLNNVPTEVYTVQYPEYVPYEYSSLCLPQPLHYPQAFRL